MPMNESEHKEPQSAIRKDSARDSKRATLCFYLSQNAVEYRYVWYRVFKFTKGKYYGKECIKLGGGYFFNFYTHQLSAIRASLEMLPNGNPQIRSRLAVLRFYERWLDPVVLPCLRILFFMLRRPGMERKRVREPS
jgi:hypothetical protein